MSSAAASIFGRFAQPIAALVAVASIAAAFAGHLHAVAIAATDQAWLDALAFIVVGLLFGIQSAVNGAGALAASAHARLDAIGAPIAAASSTAETIPPADAAPAESVG